jgi:orotidine-5'-phosphate decarboxylase
VRAGWRARDGRTVGPIIVSSSRAILYASDGADFAAAARQAAEALRRELADARSGADARAG